MRPRISILVVLIALCVFTSDVYAQSKFSGKQLARTQAQEFQGWWWSDEGTRYEENGLPSRPDRTIITTGKDSIEEVWHFRPQSWMTEHCASPIILDKLNPDRGYWPYLAPRYREYRLKLGDPETVVEEEYEILDNGVKHRQRVRHYTYDRASRDIAELIDTVFNQRGNPVEASTNTSATGLDSAGNRFWQTTRSKYLWKGNPVWRISRSQSIDMVRLLRDENGNEFLKESDQEVNLPDEVIEWPKDYRRSALDIGRKNIQANSEERPRYWRRYTDLRWESILPEYSELSLFNRYRIGDKMIVYAVRVDSSSRGNQTFDTLTAAVDEKGRIVSRSMHGKLYRYEYDDRGVLVRIEEWSKSKLDRVKWTEYVRARDSSILVMKVSEAEHKYDRPDTSILRFVSDYEYPTFDDLAVDIDSLAKITFDRKTSGLTVQAIGGWSSALSFTLSNPAGKEVASTTRSTPTMNVSLAPSGSVYILRYLLNGQPIYEKTIIADNQE